MLIDVLMANRKKFKKYIFIPAQESEYPQVYEKQHWKWE